MSDLGAKKFAIAHVGPEGRVALCEIFGDVIRVDCSFMPQGELGAVGSRPFQADDSGQVADTTSV